MTIEKLNLVLSYPVKWTAYSVLRDFVQNFFDSIGPENFGKEFVHSYDEKAEILTMRANRGFSREWLSYIGTSTKRDGQQKTVGKYGEGFKIAALCAYRDLHWDVVMESRGWRIHVAEAADEIDGKALPVLAYEVSEREPMEDAVLTLKGVKAEDGEKEFGYALDAYDYPGNPKFGEQIIAGDGFAVYKCEERGKYRCGRLYAGCLMRAGLDTMLIVCNREYTPKKDTREREDFNDYEVSRCLKDVVAKMTPGQARIFLENIQEVWHGKPPRFVRKYDWPGILKDTIEKVAESDKEMCAFRRKYGHELLTDFHKSEYGNRRAMALKWMRVSDFRGRRLVLPCFWKVGIADLDELCRTLGGYDQTRDPEPIEAARIEILEEAAVDIFGALLCYDSGLPPVEVQTSEQAPHDGTAYIRPAETHPQNKCGIAVKYEIRKIAIRQDLLGRGIFPEALTTYLHELLHQFGGDSSEPFRRAIRMMSGRMYIAAGELEKYEKQWDALDDSAENAETEGGEADA